ncbi:Hint domain-containing protein [Commensalibacter oyaizuii]
MTLGPKLPDGRQTVILVSDNNFNPSQYKTQFISFILDDGDACFLPGTFIKAQQGLVRVEDIIPGDLVYSLEQGTWRLRQVIWTGMQTAQVCSDCFDDMAGYPVCIRKDAIEEGVPFADLYVTAEHCMWFDDYFVPIRMLVNNKTIFYDRNIKTYDYYHIETDKHTVIMANGALSESFLDTGNRHYFTAKTAFATGKIKVKTWDHDAAFPLITKGGNAEQIFNRLNKRADMLGIGLVEQPLAKTDYPDLHLITNQGEILRPIENYKEKAVFELPADVHYVRLMSRTYRPCDVHGPFVDNRHVLGVLVGDIVLENASQDQKNYSHLFSQELSGWLPKAQLGIGRWTSGDAYIPLQKEDIGHFSKLSLQILEAGPYLIQN